MARRQDQGVLRQLHALLNVGAIGELTDGQLLERFATAPREISELAFAVLVERHGPMVLRVCQGVLAEPHDRQDAFQATFLVLVRRASALWVRDSLGPWLHQVAYRTACHARAAAARRRWHERRAAELTKEALDEVDNEPERLLHEEIHRLPERYRVPIVLCDLGGRTHEQAARHLGWPVGTVKSRLARGRAQLRDRLRRRGVDANSGLLALALRPGGAGTAVPHALAEATTRAAIQTLMGRTVLAGSAAALTTGVHRTMSAIHGLKVAVLVLAVAAATTGAPLLAQRGRKRAPAAPTTPAAPAADEDARDPQTLVVKPGRVNGSLVTQGQLRSVGFVDVFSSAEGQATILSLVPDRTVVEKGQLVCELDSSALRQQLLNQEIATKGAEAAYQNAKLAREVAEIALTEYVEGVFPQKQMAAQGEVATAQDELKMAENRVERAQRAKKRLNDLLDPKVGPKTPADVVAELEIEDRLDAAAAAVKREKLAVERAENNRKVLERFTRDKAVKELNADIDKARAMELTKREVWELEQLKEQKLRTQIANCKLLAPRDGVVLYATESARALGAGMGGIGGGMGGFGGMGGLGGGMGGPVSGGGGARPIQEGETVHERQKIFSMPTGPFTVTIAASKAVADRLAVGNAARITPNATLPGEVLHGTVEKITAFPATSPAARKGGGRGRGQVGPAMGNGALIAVKIDKSPLALVPGAFARAEIFANERDGILTVPNESIIHAARDRERVVVKKPDGTFELRAVTPGPANDTMTEILQGLEKGESIVLDPANVSDEELRQEISQLQPQFQ